MNNFAKRLKNIRLDNHITQEVLASKIKISQTTISAYEQGKIRPTDDMIISFCKYFNVSADYLLGLSDDF